MGVCGSATFWRTTVCSWRITTFATRCRSANCDVRCLFTADACARCVLSASDGELQVDSSEGTFIASLSVDSHLSHVTHDRWHSATIG
jgi:hypothetical protein